MTDEVTRYLVVGAVLFVLGAIGFITRRNLIVMVLSAEMMLHGVSLTLVTFSRMHHSLEGQAFTIFILTVAACEAGLALSLILAQYRRSNSLDVELWASLREPDLLPPLTEIAAGEQPFVAPEPQHFPRLTPAGRVPEIDGESENATAGQAAGTNGQAHTAADRQRDVVDAVKS